MFSLFQLFPERQWEKRKETLSYRGRKYETELEIETYTEKDKSSLADVTETFQKVEWIH